VWLKDLTKLEDLLEYVEDEDFREDWAAVKQANKERLAHHMQVSLGLKVNTQAMFDVQIKVSRTHTTSWYSRAYYRFSGYTSIRWVDR
jgi:glucan phosphorylase